MIPVLALLLSAPLSAQTATRFGVYEGMGFTAITYNFLGKEHDRKIESMVHIGLALEIPLADRVLLSIRPAISKLNDNAGLASRVQTETGSVYQRSFVKEQWIFELPLMVKAVLDGQEMRPYFGLGGFLDYNSNPAEIRITDSVDPSNSPSEAYAKLYGGVIAAVGLEIKAASVLLITPEIAVRQMFSRPLDTALFSQNNNPRFLLSIGILFLLSPERW